MEMHRILQNSTNYVLVFRALLEQVTDAYEQDKILTPHTGRSIKLKCLVDMPGEHEMEKESQIVLENGKILKQELNNPEDFNADWKQKLALLRDMLPDSYSDVSPFFVDHSGNLLMHHWYHKYRKWGESSIKALYQREIGSFLTFCHDYLNLIGKALKV